MLSALLRLVVALTVAGFALTGTAVIALLLFYPQYLRLRDTALLPMPLCLFSLAAVFFIVLFFELPRHRKR